MFTLSICSGFNPAALIAAFAATVWRVVALVFLKAPPKVPKAVLLALTMKIPARIRLKGDSGRITGQLTFSSSRHGDLIGGYWKLSDE